MTIENRNFVVRVAATAGAAAVALTLSLGAASAQDKIYTMKISLPTLNDPSYFFAKSYAAALEKDSGGRIKPKSIRRASSARSRGRSKARNSAPSNARSFRPNSSSASTSVSS
jgi:hypothetical protein